MSDRSLSLHVASTHPHPHHPPHPHLHCLLSLLCLQQPSTPAPPQPTGPPGHHRAVTTTLRFNSPVPAALSRDRRRYGTRALPVFGMYSLSLLPDSCQGVSSYSCSLPAPVQTHSSFLLFSLTILPITPTCLPSYLSIKQHIHSLRLHHFISLAVPVLKLAKMHFPTLNPQYGAHYHLKLLGFIHQKDFK